MSKIGNALKMMMLLKMRGKMKLSQLATELEVSERQVKKYRDDLEMAAIFITSTTGSNGGYELMDYDTMRINLTQEEVFILDSIVAEFQECNHIYFNDIKDIVNKIKYNANIQDGEWKSEDFHTMEPISNCNRDQENNKYKKFIEAKLTRKKVRIKYAKPGGIANERIIHPYAFYNSKGDRYMVAFCEKREKIIDFKLCRVQEYELIDEKFIVDPNFSWSEYSKNCIGVWKGKEIKIKLEIQYPYAASIKEKIWSQDQLVEETGDNSIIFSATVRDSPELISWIMGMGRYVKVIEPASVRESLIKEIDMVMKNNK